MNYINFLKTTLYGLFIWLNIDMTVFVVLVSFMLLDSFTGGIKAVRLGEAFKFKKLFIGLSVKFLFLIIPLSVAMLGKGLGSDMAFGVEVIMRLLIVSEFYSFIGNVYTIKTKEEVDDIDIISMLLVALRVRAKNIIENGLNIIKGNKK